MAAASKRPVRIGGASGSASDRRTAISEFAASGDVDFIIGDWMSEYNMTIQGMNKASRTEQSSSSDVSNAFEGTFLEALTPALVDISKHNIKLAVNAGASDTERLHSVVVDLVNAKKLGLKVAWISGDEVLDAVMARKKHSDLLQNIHTGESFSRWAYEPVYAQAYLGGLGIAAAFDRGADIVLCGRVSDASPVIGAAAHWHGWNRSKSDELANALVAGHLIECSNYVTGGNFTGFWELEKGNRWLNIGYPIAEISLDGNVTITKQANSGGIVTADTCKSQLLYEIQGPWYFNSDVTAVLSDISFEQLGPDRVALQGVKSSPPPPTTKVGITAQGGFQAELHWFLVGLDVPMKAQMLETQIRHALRLHSDKYSVLNFTTTGVPMSDPEDQNSATVDFRVLVQSRRAEDIAPEKFIRPILDLIMCTYPGGTIHLDVRTGVPKPIYEYYVALLPQTDVHHKVHSHTGETIEIAPPSVTKIYPRQQPSQPRTQNGKDAAAFGKTVRGPLGWLVHARSGDKGSDSNVGFWVQHADEYEWLRSLLSAERVKALLGKEYNGKLIDRFELPNLWAVHFLLHDHLDRGVSCTSTLDFLGKNVAEFLRARHVDLPEKFLARRKMSGKL